MNLEKPKNKEELTQRVNVFIQHLVEAEKSGNKFSAFGVSVDSKDTYKGFTIGEGMSRHEMVLAMIDMVVAQFEEDVNFNSVEKKLLVTQWMEQLKNEALR